MLLGGKQILKARTSKKIVIEPFNADHVNPNSYDVTLDNELFQVVPNTEDGVIDMRNPGKLLKMIATQRAGVWGWLIYPGELYLGSTVETVGSHHYVPQMHGRSTPARFGFSPIVSAGWGDVGFVGTWTLEITNCAAHPIFLIPGQRIAQIAFHEIVDTEWRYGVQSGNYQGQKKTTAPKGGNV